MPRRQAGRADRPREAQQRPELQLLVAAHARVRGTPGPVLGDEVIDHGGTKGRRLVEHVMRKPELRGRGARVVDVARAAAPSADAGRGPARVGQLQRHADDVVAGLEQQSRRGGRIDAPRHRHHHALAPGRHDESPAAAMTGGHGRRRRQPARERRWRADGRRGRQRRLRSWTTPRLMRTPSPAAAASRPSARNTGDGSSEPEVQAAPVETQIPSRSSPTRRAGRARRRTRPGRPRQRGRAGSAAAGEPPRFPGAPLDQSRSSVSGAPRPPAPPRPARRHAEADDARHVLGTRAALVLLVAPLEQRRNPARAGRRPPRRPWDHRACGRDRRVPRRARQGRAPSPRPEPRRCERARRARAPPRQLADG